CRQNFPYYSVEFLARGKGSLTLAGQDHELRPGTVFSYGPGIAQEIVTDPSDLLIKYFVNFTGTRAPDLLSPPGLAPGSVRQVASPGEIQDLFDDLVRNGLKATR